MMISKEQEHQVIKLYKEFTAKEIGLELKLERYAIYSCLKRNGIKRRKVGHKEGTPSWNKGTKGIYDRIVEKTQRRCCLFSYD